MRHGRPHGYCALSALAHFQQPPRRRVSIIYISAAAPSHRRRNSQIGGRAISEEVLPCRLLPEEFGTRPVSDRSSRARHLSSFSECRGTDLGMRRREKALRALSIWTPLRRGGCWIDVQGRKSA